MEWYVIAGIAFLVLVALMATGLPIAFTLGLLSIGMLFVKLGPGAFSYMATTAQSTIDSFVFIVIPLFVLMAEILAFTGVSDDLYQFGEAWLGGMKGGLLGASLLACAGFAAMCGSSAACSLTIGTVAIPKMVERGYDRRFVIGSIAAGGCLGILIPPSLNMILYAIVTEQSIGTLFIAGVIPGIVLSAIMIIYVLVRVRLNPTLAPNPIKIPWKEKGRRTLKVWAPILMAIGVMGSIYGGFSTASEAAAVGVTLALFIGLIYRKLHWSNLKESLLTTVVTTSFICLIIVGAMMFGIALTIFQIPQELSAWIVGLPISRWGVMILIMMVLLFLGMFLDIASIVLITMPIFFPVIKALHFDPIWFGVLVVINMEVGLITPPVGINCFVMGGMAKKYGATMNDVFLGALPFVVLFLLAIALVMAFPQLALWLPNTMLKR